MTQPQPHILVLCTGNSCRSILGEAMLKHFGAGRFQVYSAGSRPLGRVNQDALATLARHGLPTEGYCSKSMEELADKPIDILITVCDSAAGEACPAYLGQVARAHWGMSDPGHVKGSPKEVETAFEQAYALLERRVQKLLALPLETMTREERGEALNRIGAETL